MPRSATTEREYPGRPAAIRPPAFVGRERELAALTQTLASEPTVVLVEGEAGIGKTRLIKEFLASPVGQHLSALVATCPPFRQPHTLGPIADAVRQSATGRIRDLKLSALAGALRPLFPDWAMDLPSAPEPVEDPTTARHRVFIGLAELLAALDIGMLIVEDLHWADDATLEFLLFLATRQPQQVSMLVTCRPEDVPQGSLLPRLSRRAAGTTGLRLALRALTVDQTIDLVSSMLAGESITAEFAGFLHERTEGLPLAVEECVRLMGDRADLAFRHGAWARRHLADIEVPPTVRDAVLERAARLSDEAVTVLRAAAVLGEPAAEATLMAVGGLTGIAAQAGLGEAVGCGLLGETFPDGQQLTFRHTLASRAVYESIPIPLRRELHLRAGRSLEQAPTPLYARLARHFREASDNAAWVRYGEQAAALSLAAGDHNTAAVLLHDLVTRAGLPPRGVARLTAKIPLRVLSPLRLSRLAGALQAILDAQSAQSDDEGEVRCQLGRVLVEMDDWSTACAELERAVPHLANNPVAAANAMILLGWPLGTERAAFEHLRWLRLSRDLEIPAGSLHRLHLLESRATALLILGEEEGWAEAARIPADAPTGAERSQITWAYLNTGEAAMVWGRYAEARRRLSRGLELAISGEFQTVLQQALATVAHMDWLTGSWDGLTARVSRLLDPEDVHPRARLDAILVAGLIASVQGSDTVARQHLKFVLDEQARRGIVLLPLEPAAALGRMLLRLGQADEAVALTEESMRVLSAKGTWLWGTDIAPVRVQALAASGRREDAAELVAAFARGISGRDAPAAQASLVTCQALLAEANDEYQHAAELFEGAAAAWQVLPRPYDMLLARERQGRCLLAAEQDQAGLELLSEVYRNFSNLGASLDAGRVMKTLRGYGVSTATGRRGRRSYGTQLSPRELEVVRLLAAGRPVREIAGALFLSPKTVNCHLESARRKLNVPSRIALAVAAAEAGIVSGEPDTSAP